MSETTTLPTWDEMTDVDKGCALMHLWKRHWEGARYAEEEYPARYMDDPRLVALGELEASEHAASLFGDWYHAGKVLGEERDRLYELALEEPNRRCLWGAHDGWRTYPVETREKAVELLKVSWPHYRKAIDAADRSKWALMTRDEPGGEWRAVPL